MNRRKFITRSTVACAAAVLLPGSLPAQAAEKAAAPASSGTSGTGASGTGKVPDYAKDMLHSDSTMDEKTNRPGSVLLRKNWGKIMSI